MFHLVPQRTCTASGAAQKGGSEPSLGRNSCGWSRQRMAVLGKARGSPPQGGGWGSKPVSLSQRRCWSKGSSILISRSVSFPVFYFSLAVVYTSKRLQLFVFKILCGNKALRTNLCVIAHWTQTSTGTRSLCMVLAARKVWGSTRYSCSMIPRSQVQPKCTDHKVF